MSEIKNAIIIFAVFTIIFGVIYPLVITGITQVAFPSQANGELIKENGVVIGSQLIGQNFSSPQYFQGRPSYISYNASTSGGTNLGPDSQAEIGNVSANMLQVIQENNLPANSTVPSDLVEASASGLDSDIYVSSAVIQVPRIAAARNISQSEVSAIVTENEQYQLLDPPIVNVLTLNIALDKLNQ
ncbi:MAG: potassium-transporting ATPase subunit KdpC [Methanobacterium sp.]